MAKVTRDVYSFGLVCYYLVSNGHSLHRGENDWESLIRDTYSAPLQSKLDPLFDLLRRSLEETESNRLDSLSGVRKLLLNMFVAIS